MERNMRYVSTDFIDNIFLERQRFLGEATEATVSAARGGVKKIQDNPYLWHQGDGWKPACDSHGIESGRSVSSE